MKLNSLQIMVGLVGVLTTTVRGDDFTFSFTSGGGSGLAGTVTGEIYGLSANATSAATDVVITSIPSGMTNVVSSLPLDVSTGWHTVATSFTASDGQSTGGSFLLGVSVEQSSEIPH